MDSSCERVLGSAASNARDEHSRRELANVFEYFNIPLVQAW